MDRRPPAAAQRLFDHGSQIQRPLERLFHPAAQDGRGDPARLALVAVQFEDVSHRPVVPAVDDVGGGLARIAHPHVQRTVAHEGKAALGLVQLHRGNPNVEHHTVQPRLAAVGKGLGQTGEGCTHQPELARIVVGHSLGMRLHRRIAIEGDHCRAGRQNRAGIAAGPEGGVDDHIAGNRSQGLDHFGQQDGGVGRRHPASPFMTCRARARRALRRAFQRARSQI